MQGNKSNSTTVAADQNSARKYISDHGRQMTADEKIKELAEKLSQARDVIFAETKLGISHPMMHLTAYKINE